MGAAALQLLWVSATTPQRFYLTLNHLMLNINFTLLYAAGQMFKFDTSFLLVFCLCLTSFLPKLFWSSSSFEGYPLQVRHKQGWGRGFILLLPQTAALPESDAGSDVIKPASSFVIQNRQTSCSMCCPIYRACC